VHVPLAPNRLVTESPGRVRDDAEEEHAGPQRFEILMKSDVHADGIYRVGSRALRVTQALSDRVEPAEFRLRSETFCADLPAQRITLGSDVDAGVEVWGHGCGSGWSL
jgi:hypothetical protein